MVTAQVLVPLRFAPRDAQRGDDRAWVALVLVRDQQFAAPAVEQAIVARPLAERMEMAARAIPLFQESIAMHPERCTQRLKQGGDRAMKSAAEGEAERELADGAQVDLAGQRNVAVRRRGELIVHPEILGQVLPAVGPAHVAARALDERRGCGE